MVLLLFSTGFRAEALVTAPLQVILDNYLRLKDALVKSDAKMAVEQADKLQSAFENVKQDELETGVEQQLSSIKTDLLAAMQKIIKKADLEKQRAAFGEVHTEQVYSSIYPL